MHEKEMHEKAWKPKVRKLLREAPQALQMPRIDAEMPGLPSPEVYDEDQNYISIFEKISDDSPEQFKHRVPKKNPKKRGEAKPEPIHDVYDITLTSMP